MTYLDKNIDFLTEKFDSDKCVVFCGAGMSHNSGILTVEPLLNKIFEYLNADREDVNAYLYNNDRFSLPIPFEAIIQSLKSNIDFENTDASFIDIFARLFNGEPNKNHYLLANLLKVGKIHCIVTTNFDTCIEQVLGWSEGDNRVVIPYKEHLEHLNELDLSGKIIKIHGCKTIPDLLGTTVEQITGPDFLPKTNIVLKKIFCDGHYNATVFLGYSCSDKWDISDFFKNNCINTQCLYWQHPQKQGSSEIEPNAIEMLQSHSHYFMIGDTNKLVNNLWKRYGYNHSFNHEIAECDFLLKNYIVEEPEFALNRLFQDSNLHHIAKKYCLKSIEKYNKNLAIDRQKYIYKLIKAIASLGDYYVAIHDTKNAESSYVSALQLISDNIELDKENLSVLWLYILGKLADSLKDNGNIDEAEKQYLLLIDFYENEEISNPILANIYNSIALLYERTNPAKVLDCFNKALVIFEKEANVDPVEYESDVAMVLNNIAMFYWKNHKPTEALPFMIRSLDVYRKLAFANTIYKKKIGEDLLNLGLIYKDLGMNEEAIAAYEGAIIIQRDLALIFPEMHLPKLSLSLAKLGFIYMDSDLSKAQNIAEEALDIRRNLAESKNPIALGSLVDSLTVLGNIYFKLNKIELAQVYSKESVSICEVLVKINEKQYLNDLAVSLTLCCSISEKNDSADVTNELYHKLFEVVDKLVLLDKIRYSDVAALVNFNFANYNFRCGINKKAITHYKVALSIYSKLFQEDPDNYYIKISDIYDRLISILSSHNFNIILEDAFVALSKSAIIFLTKNPNNLTAKYVNNLCFISIRLGIKYYDNREYDRSKNVYTETLFIIEYCHFISNYNIKINQALLYCELAGTMIQQDLKYWEPDKDIILNIENTYLKSYKIFNELSDQFDEHDRLNFSKMLTAISDFYKQINDWDKAVVYLEHSVQSYEKLCETNSKIEYMQRLSNNKYFLSRALINKSDNKSIEKAEKCLLDMLVINTQMSEIDSDYNFWLGGAKITLAEFYKDCNVNRQKSILFAKEAKIIFKLYAKYDDFKNDLKRIKSVIEYWNKN